MHSEYSITRVMETGNITDALRAKIWLKSVPQGFEVIECDVPKEAI